ncbi:MAG: SLC13 family permease [Fusobacteriaceae bacterium]
MGIAITSLVFLIFTIVVGFKKKMNIGVLALGFSLVLGYLGGISTNNILKGFNTSLFIMLAGVSMLFGIAQHNGTLTLIVKKMTATCGKRTYLMPIMMYIVMYFISFLGAGTIAGFALSALFGIPLAKELDSDPFLLTTMGQLGAIGGGIVPWAPTGIIGLELASKAGIMGNIASTMTLNTFLATAFAGFISYFFLKGYKLKTIIKEKEKFYFNKEQKITLLSIFIMVIGVAAFSINIGFLSFLISVCLILLKIGKEKDALNSIPWNTLLLISGMGILMNLVVILGGIKILADLLTLLMSPKTAGPILGLTSGVMSLFSSTSGVVMPTMIPTIPIIQEGLGFQNLVPASLLISAIINGSSPAGLSPVSTGGAFVMASYSENYKLKEDDFVEKFKKLFIISMINMIAVVLFILIGGFSFTSYK